MSKFLDYLASLIVVLVLLSIVSFAVYTTILGAWPIGLFLLVISSIIWATDRLARFRQRQENIK